MKDKPIIRLPSYSKQFPTSSLLVPNLTQLSLPADENPTEYIYEQIANLTATQRERFMSLSHLPDLPEEQIPFSIMQTNAFAAGESMAIFPEAARLNHACAGAFNAVYNWRDQEEELCKYCQNNTTPIPSNLIHIA